MAGNFQKPALTDQYTDFAAYVRDLFADISKGLDPALSLGTLNYPTDAIRWSGTNSRWERYDGNIWNQLVATYNINTATTDKWKTARAVTWAGDMTGTASASVDGSANITLTATLGNINSNTGSFGSASAVPVITVNSKGLITAVSTAALQSMATQTSSNVNITGGSISGTAITLKSGTGTTSTEGVMEWSTASDVLYIGTGTSASVFSSNLASATLQNKTMGSGSNWNGNAVPVLYGGTGATDAATARGNLGCGSLATQNSSSVSITGGTIQTTNINLVGSASAAPTIEGRIEWDTDNDLLVVGTGTITEVFAPLDPSTVQTQTNLTLSTGCTWNGNTVGVAYGGTGITSYTIGDILYASGTTTLSKLTAGTSGFALLSGGAGAAPSWQSLSLSGSAITGTLPVNKGGTGATDAATARTNLSVPSTTGTGASGSWAIDITGSSASCTGNANNITTGGGYKHIGSWGVGATDPSSVLVNRAYMSDTCTGNAASASALIATNNYTIANRLWLTSGGMSVYYDGQAGFLTTGSGWAIRTDNSGNFTATGNVTAYSDERLKTNWRELDPEFLQKLAEVKVGIYDRTDLEEHPTQVGVSAQSLQKVLPEAVVEQSDGMLGVSYGSAALATCVLLAREVVQLRKEIEALK